MEFRCRLATPTGEVREEVLVADTEASLRRDLEDKGFLVLSVRTRGLRLPDVPGLRRQRVPTSEFVVFNQELATLLKAGMPLVQSLDILRQRVANPTLKSVLDDVHERVRSGASLSEAFEAHGDLFPGVYTASLLAGEKSGGLEQVLRRFVAYMKVLGAVRRRTLSALMYPTVLVVLSLAVVAQVRDDEQLLHRRDAVQQLRRSAANLHDPAHTVCPRCRHGERARPQSVNGVPAVGPSAGLSGTRLLFGTLTGHS